MTYILTLLYRYVLNLKLPNFELRKLLWERLIPKKAPVSADIDYRMLAERWVMLEKFTFLTLSLSLSLS